MSCSMLSGYGSRRSELGLENAVESQHNAQQSYLSSPPVSALVAWLIIAR